MKERYRDVFKIDDPFVYILVTKYYKSGNISKDLFQNSVWIVGFAFEKPLLIVIVATYNFKCNI